MQPYINYIDIGFLLCKIPKDNADLNNPLEAYCLAFNPTTQLWERPNWGRIEYEDRYFDYNHLDDRCVSSFNKLHFNANVDFHPDCHMWKFAPLMT